jgi:hypothetical protein
MKKTVFMSILCCTVCSVALPQYTLDSTRRMSPGVVRKSYSTTSPNRIHVMEISFSESTVQLQAVKSAGVINGPKQTVPQMYAAHDHFNRHDVTAGINADFFTSQGPQYNPRHMMIGDGEILWDTMLNRTVFGITENRTPFITKLNESYSVTAGGSSFTIRHINRARNANELVLYNRFKGSSTGTSSGGTELRIEPVDGVNAWKANASIQCKVLAKSTAGNMSFSPGQAVLSGVGAAKTFLDAINVNDVITLNLQVLTTPSGITNIKQLTGGWTRLVLDGANCVTASVADEGGPVPNDLAPRTAVGFNAAKNKVYFVVVDGRNPGVSVGMTLNQLANFMIYLGCYQALNLDGGGSSTMVGNGKLVNDPSDAGGAREVASALLAYLTSITLDDFENGVGHFNRPPTYSSTTVGVSTSSVVTNALTCHSGNYSLIVKLYDNPSSSANWKVRLLSGSGEPSNNRYFPGTGTFSFYMKTNTANTGAKVRIWLDDNDGTELSPQLDVINDGQWHKYVWSLSNYNGTSTDGGNGVINSSGARLDAIEFSQPNTSQTWFIFIDDIMVDPNGTAGTGTARMNVAAGEEEEAPVLQEPSPALMIYPNPGKGFFTLDLSNYTLTSCDIQVFNSLGKLVFSRKATQGGIQKLDLSHLKSGLYFVQVRSDTFNKTDKLIIE